VRPALAAGALCLGLAAPVARSHPPDFFPAEAIAAAALGGPGEGPLAAPAPEASDEDPADAGTAAPPPEPALDRLEAGQRYDLLKIRRGRRARYAGLALGLLSTGAILGGAGALRRADLCDEECPVVRNIGIGAVVGGLLGVEVGAVVGLLGAGTERDGLVSLSGRDVENVGLTTGWALMVSQVFFLPFIGALAAHGLVVRQGIDNDEALERLRREGPRIRVSAGRIDVRF
jgi:hypothetical protein